MQDEEFDHMDELIRAASNSYHPAYDDKAWDKMEALLDKHLPQNEDRRRPLAWILLTTLLVGGALFVLLYPWDKSTDRTTSDTSMVTVSNQSNKNLINKQDLPNDTHTATTTVQPASSTLPGEIVTNYQSKRVNTFNSKHTGRFSITNAGIATGDDVLQNEKELEDQSNQWKQQFVTDISLSNETAEPLLPRLIASPNQADKVRRPASPFGIATTQPVVPIIPPGTTKKERNSKKGFASNFAVLFSAGPDLSFVGLQDPGKTRLTYGAGLSYRFFSRLTVRAGFYKATKIYSASPGEYHPPAGYWTYNTNLERVDANCKVYEIPLSLAYQFGQAGKHSWFASAGLSSYLMKSETYNYLYKNQAGQTMYKGWTLKNKNKHYFSVLTISGGYQYQMNKRITLVAEPYVKLPLHGVGFGKIKLNSGGLLFTAAIRPFAGKPRQ